jgi:hypothetical protein
MLHANFLGRAARYFRGTNRACSQERRSTFRKLHERVARSVKGRVDTFGLHVDPDETGYFDNNPSWSHETVWGVYSTLPLTTKSTAATLNNISLDLFYIGFQHGGRTV